MLNGKKRASLRACANGLEAILQVGKEGISDAVIRQADEALTARELIKGKVLENAPVTAREAAQLICDKTGSEPIQVIGNRFVIFRRNPKNPSYDSYIK